MASDAAQALPVTKVTPNNAATTSPAVSRALAEITPLGIRRNSPSFNVDHLVTKKSAIASNESSPFDASPSQMTLHSPHSFWKKREHEAPQSTQNENARPGSVSPTRRASIENLKRQSRVTNNSMFARGQEVDADPENSILSNSSTRPLQSTVPANAFGSRSSSPVKGHNRSESNVNIPILSPSGMTSQVKAPQSPQKSSLSSVARFCLPMASTDSTAPLDAASAQQSPARPTPRTLRKPKSVTFDEQPPQINEYEMVTPDPSSIASGSREGSYESDVYDMDDGFEDASFQNEDSFDASLEDAAKTPVVLPEDWRFMSPRSANTGLAQTFEDPFEKAKPSSIRYRSTPERDIGVARSDSVTSNGEQRPLPPLPALLAQEQALPSPEAVTPLKKSSSVRGTPPRPASMSKADILNMRSSPMPLEERLKQLSLQNEEEALRRRTSVKENSKSAAQIENSDVVAHEPSEQYRPPPRISRESILRNVESQGFSLTHEPVGARDAPSLLLDANGEIDYANLDPDVPVPSRETSSTYEEDAFGNRIRREGEIERTISMYSRASSEDEGPRSISPFDDGARESSVIHHKLPSEEVSELDDEDDLTDTPFVLAVSNFDSDSGEAGLFETDGAYGMLRSDFPRSTSADNSHIDNSHVSLPELGSFFEKNDLSFGLESFLTPSPDSLDVEQTTTVRIDASKVSSAIASNNVEVLSQFSEPVLQTTGIQDQVVESADAATAALDDNEDGASTPDSVIHCPLEEENEELAPFELLEVPEPVATIKASDSVLKTRVSATPADIRQMAATRRHVSGERPESIDERQSELSYEDGESLSFGGNALHPPDASIARSESLRKLEVPINGIASDLEIGLTAEFDRLLEAKKKGYLMRQNTKLIVANSRQASGESKDSESAQRDVTSQLGSTRSNDSSTGSPRKGRTTQTWTTEPWNGKTRRQSARRTTIVPEKKMTRSAIPPVPGTESNFTTDSTTQGDELGDDDDELRERGRLFVKVMRVKDLDLPLPKNEQCHFQMTLDNGLHCVTTSWAELSRNALIGQEFELVVFEDLEFQLTLQTRLERPKSSASSVMSMAPSVTTKKASAFSRLFTSPKKRKEKEMKSQEEDARAALQLRQDFEAQQSAKGHATAWELQNELVGPDGSFARAYIALSNHEREAYGRPFTVDIPAWNEWAIEDRNAASTRSKMGGVQRKPPYCIGKIELQMMYIPRPREAKDEDMPKSMTSAVRQLKEAEATVSRTFEGHLSQQGGDCPYWRRRFFKLNGSKLTAYHDTTRQPRATISLAKASKLIDDKSSLTKVDPTSPTKSKGRRKSAFAEDEEGYMFVEEGFRIRFANGEVIDFYADNCEQKEAWMKVLSEAVGRDSPMEKKTWMSMVLDSELAAGRAAAAAARPSQPIGTLHGKPIGKEVVKPAAAISAASAPSAPAKRPAVSAATNGKELAEDRPPPIEKSPRHEFVTAPSSPAKKASPTSPRKLAVSASPFKKGSTAGQATASSAGKRNSVSDAKPPAGSPQKAAQDSGRRKAVRSMIF